MANVRQAIEEVITQELLPIQASQEEIRNALSFSIYSSLDPCAYTVSVSDSTASRKGSSLLPLLKDYYKIAEKHYCMFLGEATHCHITSTHLWPSHTCGVGLEVMGLAESDVSSPRNYLRLHSRLEKAFDHKRIVFEHSPISSDSTEFKLRLKILDPNFKNEEISFNQATILAGTLDGTESNYTFEDQRKPYRRILAIHSQKAITQAIEMGWIDDEVNATSTRQRALELARMSLEPRLVGLLFPSRV